MSKNEHDIKLGGTPILFKVGDEVKGATPFLELRYARGVVVDVDHDNAANNGVMIYQVQFTLEGKSLGESFWYSNDELTLVDSGTAEIS